MMGIKVLEMDALLHANNKLTMSVLAHLLIVSMWLQHHHLLQIVAIVNLIVEKLVMMETMAMGMVVQVLVKQKVDMIVGQLFHQYV